MFGEQFYPTPKEVIEIMFKPYEFEMDRGYGEEIIYNIKAKTILEPSAGKGDILDFISESQKYRGKKLYAIEQDPNLSQILVGKNYRVLGDDFLSYDDDYFFELIVMNPPFKNGVDHVLKAWDILADGGEIIALVNEETVLNINSSKKELLKTVIDDYGSVEFLGNCFKFSERKTDVRVALIRLSKPETDNPFNFSFNPVNEDEEFKLEKDNFSSELAINDVLGSVIRSYKKTKEAYVNYIKARKELQFYSEPIIPKSSNIIRLAEESFSHSKSLQESYNDFNDGFKGFTWNKIMELVGIQKLMTSNVSKNFDKFCEGQGNVSITKENIHSLVMMLIQNSSSILDQAVVDVFDLFTRYYSENRLHIEGWKTNEQWKVNKKIILPNYVQTYGKFFDTNYSRSSEFRDIEKAMCYLTGKDYSSIDSIDKAIGKFPVGQKDKSTSEFFDFRCYKKGTIHLFFKDEALWARFNQKACEGKNWLGKG